MEGPAKVFFLPSLASLHDLLPNQAAHFSKKMVPTWAQKDEYSRKADPLDRDRKAFSSLFGLDLSSHKFPSKTFSLSLFVFQLPKRFLSFQNVLLLQLDLKILTRNRWQSGWKKISLSDGRHEGHGGRGRGREQVPFSVRGQVQQEVREADRGGKEDHQPSRTLLWASHLHCHWCLGKTISKSDRKPCQ